jgi:hypothetical protein
LLWKYHGITYQQLMIECYGIAGQWNAQRTKTSDRVWSYTDFHPDHFEIKKPKSGSEVVQDVVCMISGEGFTWAPGYGPDML